MHCFLRQPRGRIMGDEPAFPPLSPASPAELTEELEDKQNALKQEGVDFLEDGKLEEALGKFSDAIAVGCASALLYSRRAAVLVKLDRPKAVINDCTAALAINPDSAKAYKMRARANVKLELWEQANLDFQLGLKIDFDDETEEESKVALEKSKAIKDKVTKERTSKENDEYQTKLIADKKAYDDAMKARAAVWTDAKEEKYQETVRKAEAEKKRKSDKEAKAKETDESRAEAAKEAADKEAAEKKAAEERIKGGEGTPLASDSASNNAAGYQSTPTKESSDSAPPAPEPAAENNEATNAEATNVD